MGPRARVGGLLTGALVAVAGTTAAEIGFLGLNALLYGAVTARVLQVSTGGAR